MPARARPSGCILVVQRSANLDGSAFSALLLADGLRYDGWEVHVAFGFEGPIAAKFKDGGHTVHVVAHNNWLRTRHYAAFFRNAYREIQAAFRFVDIMKKIRPDVVYVNTSVSLAGALAARWRRIPSVWHVRELFADVGGEMHVPPGMKPPVRATMRFCSDRIVVNSKAVAENMLGRHEGHVDVVANAVSQMFFEEKRTPSEARSDLGLEQDGVLIGIPGTLRPIKGHPFFLEAAAGLVRENPQLRIAVTGGGSPEYQSALEDLARKLGIENNVDFLGPIDDMPAFYRACDIVCIPSVAEPFGRTVIEAFAVGTAVIATAVGGMNETIDPGKNGLLVPYGDHRCLDENIRRLLADPALRRQLVDQALADATTRFCESVYQRRIGGIVEEVVTHRSVELQYGGA